MIYAIECGERGPVKIGITTDPKGRLMDLQVGCPYELRLLAVAAWPDSLETRLHAFLSRSNIRGEWFKSDDDRILDVLLYLQDAANGLQRVKADLAAFSERERQAKLNRRRDKRIGERLAWWMGGGSKEASRA